MKITVKEKERGEDRTVEYELDELHITGNSAEEREVTVTASADEDVIHIYTSDDSYLTKFKKFLINPDSGYIIKKVIVANDKQISGVMLEAPKRSLSFISGAKPVISEERRAALSERAKKLHEFRK